MFQTFGSSQIRCEVHKSIWDSQTGLKTKLLIGNSPYSRQTFFTNLFVDFTINFWTSKRICEIPNEGQNMGEKLAEMNVKFTDSPIFICNDMGRKVTLIETVKATII